MCRRNSFVDREGRGDTAEALNPFPGEECGTGGDSCARIAGAHPQAQGHDPLLPPISLSLQDLAECIWDGVSMATWGPHPETSEKTTGGVPKNGDQRPSAFGGVTKVLSSPQDVCEKKTQ